MKIPINSFPTKPRSYVQVIWGWPGPDYDVAKILKWNDDGSFEAEYVKGSMNGSGKIETLRFGEKVCLVRNPATLMDYRMRYG